ncbi:MAG: hypothetical protein KIS78_13820 [Labilithrix sp.]|nr:hypothetical protein [Labilithrix sp.]MCW5833476.1 hypothetical protein [Labilithrix sp.]
MAPRRLVGMLAVGAASWLAARAAPAAPLTDEQVAQSLFETARALMERGDYARACPMLAESQRLDPGGGTLLNVALCHEGEGKLATAYFELNQAAAQAVKDGRKDREDIARQHLAELAPRLPRLLVRVAAPHPEGLAIQIDGAPANVAILDVPTPVDPGKHVVEVSAPGYETSRWEGESAPSVTSEVTVTLQPTATGSPAARTPDVERPKRGTSARTYLFLGAGGLAIGSIVFFALSTTARSAALEKCIPDRNFCSDDDGVGAVGRARGFAWASIGALGAAAILGGVGLFVSDGSSPAAATLSARPVAGGGALSFERRF